MPKIFVVFERGKAAPKQRGDLIGRPAWDATGCCVGGGMMKRKIFEKIKMIKEKFVLCMMLAGFAAMNTGFTEQANIPVDTPVEDVKIKETSSKEPTAIAVGEDGKLKVSEDDESARAFAEVVERSLGRDLSLGNPLDNALDKVPEVEEKPPENVVETSRGYVRYSQVMSMEATAYLPTDGGVSGLTATGIPARHGIVAVDPNVIPLGTRVYIPGYGEALAADTGGAIYGYKIDLCMESYYQAIEFGRRTITVFVLE